MGLRPLECWDSGFKSIWGHGYSSILFVACCLVISVCPFVLMGHSDFHATNFYQISYLEFLLKFVDAFWFLLNSNKHFRRFVRKSACILCLAMIGLCSGDRLCSLCCKSWRRRWSWPLQHKKIGHDRYLAVSEVWIITDFKSVAKVRGQHTYFRIFSSVKRRSAHFRSSPVQGFS